MSEERIDPAPKQKLPKNKKLHHRRRRGRGHRGGGAWVFDLHNSPSFCSVFYTPMDSYVETYDQQ